MCKDDKKTDRKKSKEYFQKNTQTWKNVEKAKSILKDVHNDSEIEVDKK